MQAALLLSYQVLLRRKTSQETSSTSSAISGSNFTQGIVLSCDNESDSIKDSGFCTHAQSYCSAILLTKMSFCMTRHSLINVAVWQHKGDLTAGGQESVWRCVWTNIKAHSEDSSALSLKLMGIFHCLKYSSLLTAVSVKPRRAPLHCLSPSRCPH